MTAARSPRFRRAELPRTAWLLLAAGVLLAAVAVGVSVTVLFRGAGARDRLEAEVASLRRQQARNRRTRAVLEAAAAVERAKLAELSARDAAQARDEIAEVQREEARLRAELEAARHGAAETEGRIAELEQRLVLERRRVSDLDRERTAGERILARYQNGVGLVQGIWSLKEPGGRAASSPASPAPGRAAAAAAIDHQVFSGTGFLVSTDGLILTNRHIAQPWWGEEALEQRIAHGATPRIDVLRIYFPGAREPFDVQVVAVSEDADVAVLKAFLGDRRLPVLRSTPAPRRRSPVSPSSSSATRQGSTPSSLAWTTSRSTPSWRPPERVRRT